MTGSLLPSYGRLPLRFVRGEGSWLITEDGTRYLDFLSGIGVNALGHAHPRWVAALQDQLTKLTHISNLYESDAQQEAGARLCRATGLDFAFFSNSGTEANEAGLKMARRFQKESGREHKTRVLALEGGFHGRSMGALSITAHEAYRAPFAPLVPGAAWIRPGDIDALERELNTGDFAVLVVEILQGEAGVRPVCFEFLRRARAVCTATDTLLMVDEVQTGCGRTGHFLASKLAGITPDIVSLAKPLAAGIPIGATLCKHAIGTHMTPGTHGSTFGGNEFACRAALVFLDELEEHGLLAHVREVGAAFEAGLRQLVDKYPSIAIDVQGYGLMRSLVLREDSAPYARALQEEGLLAIASGGTRLRFLPPFTVSHEEVDDAVRRIARALENASVPATQG